MTSPADIAKEVRKALKANFPEVKFSVRSKIYSGGGSVTAYWVDGPTRKQVEALINQFQTHSYYIFADRSYSSEFITEVIEYCKSKHVECAKSEIMIRRHNDETAYFETNGGWECERLIQQELARIEYGKVPNWKQECIEKEQQRKAEKEAEELAKQTAIAENPCDLDMSWVGMSYEHEGQLITITGVEPSFERYTKNLVWRYTTDKGGSLYEDSARVLLFPIKPVITELETPIFIQGKWSSLNKLETLEEYQERCNLPEFGDRLLSNWSIKNSKIIEHVQLTNEEWDLFSESLLHGFDWLAKKGGHGTLANLPDIPFHQYTEEQQEEFWEHGYTICLAVSAPDRDVFLVDPEGYAYARYVGLVENQDEIKDKLGIIQHNTPYVGNVIQADFTSRKVSNSKGYVVISDTPQIEPITSWQPPTPVRKGLLVNVLKMTGVGDSTLGGVSSQYTTLLLVGEGVAEVFEESDRHPVVELKKKTSDGRDYLYCEPVGGAKTSYAAGGNFVHCSDSRFRDICPYPIPVHDRDLNKERSAR